MDDNIVRQYATNVVFLFGYVLLLVLMLDLHIYTHLISQLRKYS